MPDQDTGEGYEPRPYADGALAAAIIEETRAGLAVVAAYEALQSAQPGDFDPVRAQMAWNVGAADLEPLSAQSRVPDPTSAEQHAVKRGRNKRGATAKVVGRGSVRMTGPDPAGLHDMFGRVMTATISDIDLVRMADEWAAERGEELPELLGTASGLSWEQMVRTDGQGGPQVLAQHRTDLLGGIVDPRRGVTDGTTFGDLVAGSKVAYARPVTAWPTRRKLPAVSLRKAERATIERTAVTITDVQRWAQTRQTVTHEGQTLVTFGDTVRADVPRVAAVKSAWSRRISSTRRRYGRMIDATADESLASFYRCERDRTVADLEHARDAAVERATARGDEVPVSIPTETIHRGNRTDRRGGKVTTIGARRRAERARAERAATYRAAAVQCANGAAIMSAWNAAPLDESVTVDLPAGGTLTFRRSDGAARVVFTYRRGDLSKRLFARSPEGVALAVARIA